MNLRNTVLALFTAGALITSGRALAKDGEALNVHNKTGHKVLVFLFQDDKVHLDETGGVQIAEIADGEAKVADVPHCKFGVVLVDHDDVWHAEFHDCHSTDMTFTKDTNHVKKPAHH